MSNSQLKTRPGKRLKASKTTAVKGHPVSVKVTCQHDDRTTIVDFSLLGLQIHSYSHSLWHQVGIDRIHTLFGITVIGALKPAEKESPFPSILHLSPKVVFPIYFRSSVKSVNPVFIGLPFLLLPLGFFLYIIPNNVIPFLRSTCPNNMIMCVLKFVPFT